MSVSRRERGKTPNIMFFFYFVVAIKTVRAAFNKQTQQAKQLNLFNFHLIVWIYIYIYMINLKQ
jgi:hypothetical protein